MSKASKTRAARRKTRRPKSVAVSEVKDQDDPDDWFEWNGEEWVLKNGRPWPKTEVTPELKANAIRMLGDLMGPEATKVPEDIELDEMIMSNEGYQDLMNDALKRGGACPELIRQMFKANWAEFFGIEYKYTPNEVMAMISAEVTRLNTEELDEAMENDNYSGPRH